MSLTGLKTGDLDLDLQDFQRFALNLPGLNSFGYYFKDNVGGGKGLHQIFYVQIVFGYYFANNVGGATI